MAGHDEIEECVRAEYARLVGVVTFVTGSRPKAEDAVQEAFAKAWERAGKGERFDHLAAWVVTVALNHARSGRRREVSEQRALERLGSRAMRESTHDTDDALVVRAALADLARRQRDCVVLYYFLDLDVATVSQVLGVSEGTVKSALARARSRLAVLLGQRTLEA
jgi:RNA polymerase sigma-70 factor, ECF subfamily